MTPLRWAALVLAVCVALVAWSAATRTAPAARPPGPAPADAPSGASIAADAHPGGAPASSDGGGAPPAALDLVNVKLPLPPALVERERDAALLQQELSEMGLGPDDDDAPGE
ncbi:MAG: hypothetical protein M9894_28645 [Planctomycetes bacterium]|nr:hypothetical protein [Planctomycetota bacterium]